MPPTSPTSVSAATASVLGRSALNLGSIALLLGFLWNGPALTAAPAWQLVWHDEFTGSLGTPLNPSVWTFDTGNGVDGWGNQELQFYTSRSQNVRIEDNLLIIEAHREPLTSGGRTFEYTSGRIKAFAKPLLYGRLEARLQVPSGVGLWPAFWMLGMNLPEVGWPACGEIDIMEFVGDEPLLAYAGVHGPGYSGSQSLTTAYRPPGRGPVPALFRVFAIEWAPDRIRWLADETLVKEVTPASLPTGTTWVFNHTFFPLLNLAVGGNWAGDPSATAFPCQLRVDHIRFFTRADAPEPRLTLRQTDTGIVAAWPAQFPHGVLEYSPSPAGPWTTADPTPVLSETETEFLAEVGPGYYRLRLSTP